MLADVNFTPSKSTLIRLQHPVLDEPIAEAVCIIADTDKWTVQLASSQRRVTDVNKLGKEVLVSSLVSSLLQSTQQLYKLNLSPNFVRFTSHAPVCSGGEEFTDCISAGGLT